MMSSFLGRQKSADGAGESESVCGVLIGGPNHRQEQDLGQFKGQVECGDPHKQRRRRERSLAPKAQKIGAEGTSNGNNEHLQKLNEQRVKEEPTPQLSPAAPKPASHQQNADWGQDVAHDEERQTHEQAQNQQQRDHKSNQQEQTP